MKNLFLLFILTLCSLQQVMGQNRPFITTWSVEASDIITIPLDAAPLEPAFTYDFQYVWLSEDNAIIELGVHTSEDGPFETSFTESGTYRLAIAGEFPHFYNYPKAQLLDVKQWGDITWKSMNRSFSSWSGNGFTAGDAPDLSQVTDMSFMFDGAASFNGDLGSWDVSNVANMRWMLAGADAFNGDLSGWDVSNVTNMRWMFASADVFNQDLSSWDVSNVTDMYRMFDHAYAFNGDLSAWNVGNVTNMSGMFAGTDTFNGDLSSWDVSNVTDMYEMFYQADAFNQDLSSWDVSNVTNMRLMFMYTDVFNGDLSNWNVGNVTDMYEMFYAAAAFNQDLNSWDVSNVRYMGSMFSFSGLSLQNYDRILIGWAGQEVQNFVSFGAYGITYCQGAAARDSLITNHGWRISDGGLFCSEENNSLSLEFSEQTGPARERIATVTVENEPNRQAAWNVYPNPVSDLLHIQAQQEVKIYLTGLDGRQVIPEQTGISFEANLSGLTPGTYLLKVQEGERLSTRKIIVK